MSKPAQTNRFNWKILQEGQLALTPDKKSIPQAEHRCTSTLIWHADEPPSAVNTVLVDPCFTETGYEHALMQLDILGITFRDIGRIFVTHLHGDHMLHLPYHAPIYSFRPFRPHDDLDMQTVNCPGHHSLLLALVFTALDGRTVWVVGDAVLGEDWLRSWQYYWPNEYTPAEITETWRSVANIMTQADVIIPGHGPEIMVTADLVREMITAFPHAAHADQCPAIIETLRARLVTLEEKEG